MLLLQLLLLLLIFAVATIASLRLQFFSSSSLGHLFELLWCKNAAVVLLAAQDLYVAMNWASPLCLGVGSVTARGSDSGGHRVAGLAPSWRGPGRTNAL